MGRATNLVGEKVVVKLLAEGRDDDVQEYVYRDAEIVGVDMAEYALFVAFEDSGEMLGFNSWSNIYLKKYYNK